MVDGITTNEQKNILIKMLRKIKTESGIEDTTYRLMYATGGNLPKL